MDKEQTKAEKKAEARKKKAAYIKSFAEELFKKAFPEYVAFFLQNEKLTPEERTESIIRLADRSIDFASVFSDSWNRKKGKFLAE